MSDALGHVARITGRKFGDAANPLLVSVRSGARASMPGMMDTVLNLGLNDATVEGLAVQSGDRRFAYDSYRRFIQMYSNVVLDLDHGLFEEILGALKDENDYRADTELSAEDWERVVAQYKRGVERETDAQVPTHLTSKAESRTLNSSRDESPTLPRPARNALFLGIQLVPERVRQV